MWSPWVSPQASETIFSTQFCRGDQRESSRFPMRSLTSASIFVLIVRKKKKKFGHNVQSVHSVSPYITNTKLCASTGLPRQINSAQSIFSFVSLDPKGYPLAKLGNKKWTRLKLRQ